MNANKTEILLKRNTESIQLPLDFFHHKLVPKQSMLAGRHLQIPLFSQVVRIELNCEYYNHCGAVY